MCTTINQPTLFVEETLAALSNPKTFIFAGNALFTVKNEDTGNRFTFKVKKPKQYQKVAIAPFYFVSVLTGTNNETDYTYIGTASLRGFKLTKGSKISKEATSVKVADWLFRNIDRLPKQISIYHEGRCGKCGRVLTVPESIESGFGPECIKFID